MNDSTGDRDRLNRELRLRGDDTRGDLWCWHASGFSIEHDTGARSIELSIPLPPNEDFRLSMDRFRKNPVVLYRHDYEALPVARGMWERVRESGASWQMRAKVQFHLDTELSRKMWDHINSGLPTSWAIGVLPSKWVWENGKPRVTDGELIEISCFIEATSEGGVMLSRRRRLPMASDECRVDAVSETLLASVSIQRDGPDRLLIGVTRTRTLGILVGLVPSEARKLFVEGLRMCDEIEGK